MTISVRQPYVSGPLTQQPAVRAAGAARQAAAASTYRDILLGIAPSNLICCYPLSDAGSVAYDLGPGAYHGTYKAGTLKGAPGIGDGYSTAVFAGEHDVDILAAKTPVAAALTAGQTTILVWLRVQDAATWADATARIYMRFYVDGSNYITPSKSATANNMIHGYIAGGVSRSIVEATSWSLYDVTTTDYRCITVTIDQAANIKRQWADGRQNVVTTEVPQWTGTPSQMLIGSSIVSGFWVGGIAYFTMWNRALTDPEISLAAWRTRHVVFDGDSRTAAYTYPWAVHATISRLGMSMVGVSGHTLVQRVAAAAADVDTRFSSRIPSACVIWAGVNDGIGGATAEAIYANLQTYCLARKAAGWKVVVCTEIDGQSSALDARGWHATVYPALNALLRANHAWADGVADLGADSRLQNALDTTYYNADKVHLTTAGYTAVAEIVAPVIAGLA